MCQEVTENSCLLNAPNLTLSVGPHSAFRNSGVSTRQGGAERIGTPSYFPVIPDTVREAGVRVAVSSDQKTPYATDISKKYGTSSTVIPTGMTIAKNAFLNVSTG
jgi:hypothetical protein